MIIKGILYGAYMVILRGKAIKHSWIKKYKGQEEADKYAQQTAYLWGKYTIKTIGIDLDIRGFYFERPSLNDIFIERLGD